MVAERAAEEWGVLSLDELRACGLTRRGVLVRVRNGRLHPIHRGVYAVGHSHLSLEASFLAAVKAGGSGARLSYYSAAALWGFVSWDDRVPEITVVSAGTRIQRNIRVHRTRSLHPRDVTRRHGIPVTSPARTLVDLASLLDLKSLRQAVRRAQSMQRVNVPQLVDAMGRAGRRRGLRKLQRILASGPAPTRSELEDVVLELILQAGLEHPDVNRPLQIGGRRLIPDFRWPEQRLVVEADSAAWHEHALARADDAQRQALLEAHGERVVRVTWQQAVSRPAQTIDRLRSAGAPPDRASS